MEIPSSPGTELKIDETAKRELLTTVKWTKLLAVLGFIMISILILIAVGMTLFFSWINASKPGMAGLSLPPVQVKYMMAFGMGFSLLFLIALYIYPLIALFRFSTYLKQGIAQLNQQKLNLGFSYQKRFFRYIGILMIISLIVNLFVFFFSGFAMLMGISSFLHA